LLTDKAGKQEAKDDDDEREAGEHVVSNRVDSGRTVAWPVI